jgi:glycerol uptake facilitator-like aquaporin
MCDVCFGVFFSQAFAWAYLDDRHYNSDHLFVFWLAPLAGSMLAAWTFNLGFARKIPKEKSA